jgi:hypothetical protein
VASPPCPAFCANTRGVAAAAAAAAPVASRLRLIESIIGAFLNRRLVFVYARLEVPDYCADGRLLLCDSGVKLLLPSRSGHGKNWQNGKHASEFLAEIRFSVDQSSSWNVTTIDSKGPMFADAQLPWPASKTESHSTENPIDYRQVATQFRWTLSRRLSQPWRRKF